MRGALAVLTLGSLTALPVVASASGLDVRVGGFLPQANSNLFSDDAQLYTVGKDSWKGATGGIEFSTGLARNVELGFHVDGYGRSNDTVYREFTHSDGSDIAQTLKLTVVPVGVSLRLVPTGRRARVAPYVAVGGDLFFWQYEEFGDFIDFRNPTRPIQSDSFQSSGVTPGFHVAGGVRVPISYDFSIVGEVRYQWAKADLGGDFRPAPGEQPLRLDMSGTTVTLGLHIRF